MRNIRQVFLLFTSPIIITAIVIFEFYNSDSPLKNFIENEAIFLISALLIYLQFLLMFLFHQIDRKNTLSGKWHAEFKATNWRGQENPNILGTGSVFLVKRNFNSVGYTGNMFLAFFDEKKQIIHKGIYSIELEKNWNKVTGFSRLMELQIDSDNSANVDALFINSCNYELNLVNAKKIMHGTGKMENSQTAHEVSLRLKNE